MSLRLGSSLAFVLVLVSGPASAWRWPAWQARQWLRDELGPRQLSGRLQVARAFADLAARRAAAARDGAAWSPTFTATATCRRWWSTPAAGCSPPPSRRQPGRRRPLVRRPDAPGHRRRCGWPSPARRRRPWSCGPLYANDIGGDLGEFCSTSRWCWRSASVGGGGAGVRRGRPGAAAAAAVGARAAADRGRRLRRPRAASRGRRSSSRLGRGVNEMAARLAAMRERNRGARGADPDPAGRGARRHRPRPARRDRAAPVRRQRRRRHGRQR